jgi:hypothetical protein
MVDSAYFYVQTHANSVYWDFGDGQQLGTTDSTVNHIYTSNGTYLVSLYLFNACGADSTQSMVQIMGIGLEEESQAPVIRRLSDGTWHIAMPSQSPLEVRVCNLQGQTIARMYEESGQVTWDPGMQPAGYYLLEGRNASGFLFQERVLLP